MAEEDEGKQGDFKFYQNQPYDMEVDLNNEEDGEENDVNLNQKKAKKEEDNIEDQQDQDEANYQEVAPPKIKDLPKFDLSKFDSLPASAEAKELLSIMKK